MQCHVALCKWFSLLDHIIYYLELRQTNVLSDVQWLRKERRDKIKMYCLSNNFDREEPVASILQQYHGLLVRWVEERRSRNEV